MTVFAYPLFISTVAGLALATYALRRRSSPGSYYFALFQLCSAIWVVASAGEVVSASGDAKEFWFRLGYLGSLPLPVMWLLFTVDYTEQRDLLRGRFVALLIAIPVVSLLSAWADPVRGLLPPDSRMADALGAISKGDDFFLGRGLNPIGWLICTLGLAVLVRHLFRTKPVYRGQCVVLVLAGLIPLMGNFVYHVSGQGFVGGMDPTPLTCFVSSLLIGWGLFFYRLRDLVPLAYDALFNSMETSVAIFDDQNRLATINSSALSLLDRTSDRVAGKHIREVFADFPGLESGIAKPGSSPTPINMDSEKGTQNWEMNSIDLKDRRGDHCGRVVVGHNVTERILAEQRIEANAYKDFLTGLPNRRALHKAAERALSEARRSSSGVAVIFFDLDGFKKVNDALGHPAGDRLLQRVVSRLESSKRRDEILARLGGDEFALLIPDATPEIASRAAARFLAALRSRPFDVRGNRLEVGASAGIALNSLQDVDVDDMLAQADVALYRAKDDPGHFCLYDPQQDNHMQQQLQLESEFRQALRNGELVYKYQPFLDLRTERIVKAEALVRWNHPQRGMIHPSAFLPMVEERELIRELDRHVLDRALSEAADSDLAISVNLSAESVLHPDLPNLVKYALSRTGMAPSRLVLEITERAFAVPERAKPVLAALRSLGVDIAADDFGMGYSALEYLRHFPLTMLKLDRGLIAGIGKRVEDEAIIRAVIMIASSLGQQVVAEGVETREQLDWLREEKCGLAQGFFIARPLAWDQLMGMLEPPIGREAPGRLVAALSM